MLPMTKSELLKLVEELRAMASQAPSPDVRSALNAIADRYEVCGVFQRVPPIAQRRVLKGESLGSATATPAESGPLACASSRN